MFLWKSYFWFMVVGLIYILIIKHNILDLIIILMDLAVIHFFIRLKYFGEVDTKGLMIWKIYFIANIFYMGVMPFFIANDMDFNEINSLFNGNGILFIFLMGLLLLLLYFPLLYANYIYAFKQKSFSEKINLKKELKS